MRKPIIFQSTMLSKVIICLTVFFIAIGICLPLSNEANLAITKERRIPIYRVNRNDTVSLTFDAAWGADKTEKILDILDHYEVKTTFFLVSFWMSAYPDLVREISRRGHEIGTHSATHPDMSKLTKEEILVELQDSCNKITELTGNKVAVFRAPFGAYDNNLIDIAQSLTLTTIQWDVDSLDWKGLSAEEIAIRTQQAKGGSIILCHNNSEHIVEALPLIIEGLRAKGLSIVPVSMQIYSQNYYIDSQGTQHTKNGI